MIEVGSICIKTVGREGGNYCVVVEKGKEGMFIITGPKEYTGIRRRRCNVKHLEPTGHKIEIKSGATDAEIITILKKEGLIKKLGLVKHVVRGKKLKEKKPTIKPEEQDYDETMTGKVTEVKPVEKPKKPGLIARVKKSLEKPKEKTKEKLKPKPMTRPKKKAKPKAKPKKEEKKKK